MTELSAKELAFTRQNQAILPDATCTSAMESETLISLSATELESHTCESLGL